MSAQRHAEGEVVREAARVLRRLLQPGARLVRSERGYAVQGSSRGADAKRQLLPASLTEAFRHRDWITEDPETPGALVLSDAGEGWIRRRLAGGDGFAAQHRLETRREIKTDQGLEFVTVNEGESPLGWLRRRKGPDGRPLIDERQFTAGERLRADFERAQLSPRMAVDLTAPVVAGRRGAKNDLALPDIVIAAKQRLTLALAAVGPGLSDLLLDVCCHLIGLEAAERQKGWPQRSAKIVLGIALDRLADYYGDGRVVGTGSRLRAWSADEGSDEAAREP